MCGQSVIPLLLCLFYFFGCPIYNYTDLKNRCTDFSEPKFHLISIDLFSLAFLLPHFNDNLQIGYRASHYPYSVFFLLCDVCIVWVYRFIFFLFVIAMILMIFSFICTLLYLC